MRAIIAAIALVFAIGAALPTPTDARAPRRVEKWGCTFVARGFGTDSLGGPTLWMGYPLVRGCDANHTYIVTQAIYQDIPGEPNRLRTRERQVMVFGPHLTNLPGVLGGECTASGTPPTDPFYFRMKVERKGRPGVVRVASRNVANPCPDGTWPSP